MGSRHHRVATCITFVFAGFVPVSAYATPVSQIDRLVPFTSTIDLRDSLTYPGVSSYTQTFSTINTFAIPTFEDGFVQIRRIDVLPTSIGIFSGHANIAVPNTNVFFPTPERLISPSFTLRRSLQQNTSAGLPPVVTDQGFLDPLQFKSLPPAQIEPLSGTFGLTPVTGGTNNALAIFPDGNQNFISQQLGMISLTLETELDFEFQASPGYTLLGLDGEFNETGNYLARYDIETLKFTKSPEERQRLLEISAQLEQAADVIGGALLVNDVAKLSQQIRNAPQTLEFLDEFVTTKLAVQNEVIQQLLEKTGSGSNPASDFLDDVLAVKGQADRAIDLFKLLATQGVSKANLAASLAALGADTLRIASSVTEIIANDPPNSDYQNSSVFGSVIQDYVASLMQLEQEASGTVLAAEVRGLVGVAKVALQAFGAIDAYERYLGAIQEFDNVFVEARALEAREFLQDMPSNLTQSITDFISLARFLQGEVAGITLTDSEIDDLIGKIETLVVEDPDARSVFLNSSVSEAQLELLIAQAVTNMRALDIQDVLVYNFEALTNIEELSGLSISFSSTDGVEPGNGDSPIQVSAPSSILFFLLSLGLMALFFGGTLTTRTTRT